MAKSKGKTMEPIPQAQVKEWNALVRQTREVVDQLDNSTYQLILLAGEVTTKYGQDKITRWAEESGLTASQAKQYRWLAHKGFNQEFIDKWCKGKNALKYSVIREVGSFAGSLTSPYAEDYLQWARDHKASVAAIRGYMYEINAPQNAVEEASKSIKMALKDKQDHEGFSDYMLVALEKFVEENPEAEDKVLRTVITDEESLRQLEVKAGIREDGDADALRFTDHMIAKLKRIRGQVRDVEAQIKANISTGHERSVELHDQVKYLRDSLNAILETELPSFEHLESKEVTVPRGKTA